MISCFDNRIEQGCYNLLWQEICLSEANLMPALGAMAYGEDLFPITKFDTDGTSFGKISYISDRDDLSSDAALCFFGQVTSSMLGTKILAKGNARGLITDRTPVKDAFVLEVPTLATPQLQDAFENQIAVLSEIIEAERGTKPHNFNEEDIITCLSKKKPGDMGGKLDLIKFTSGLKYKVPSQNTALKSANLPKKKNLLNISNEEAKVESANTTTDSVSIEVGSFYEPSILNDYRGDQFQLDHAKLVQMPYYDTEDQLIKPTEVRDKLRPDKEKSSLVKKVYQLQVEKLKVFATSDLDVEPLIIAPSTPTPSAGPSTPRKRASEHFTAFLPNSPSPSKKGR
ncbi:hypothetical protein BDQ17DRAFT_1512914 [Cyathus striatus]|nr:hypothetical protein BDQ17DRAFT_1512914 [Cyathus striatus]